MSSWKEAKIINFVKDIFVEYADNDLPDEIECQLIQKTIFINGAVSYHNKEDSISI